MKKIITGLTAAILLLFIIIPSTVYASPNRLVDDPGISKWGLYHEALQVDGETVYGVNLRIHIGQTYYNYTSNTGLKFGTIKNFSSGNYNGYDTSTAQYGDDDWMAYDFSIAAPEGYSELVIESKLESDTSYTRRYTGVVDSLDIQSIFDGIEFRINETTLVYNSSTINKNGYFESSEIYRIWFQPSEDEIIPPVEPGDVINITDFNDLPVTSGYLKDAKNSTKVGYVNFTLHHDNIFDVKIRLNNQVYALGLLELPGVSELEKAPLDKGIYWTENGKKYIYYEFQKPVSEQPISEQLNIFLDDIEQVNGFRPFVTMNLTDSTYSFTDKLELYSGFYSGANGEAYADVVIPFDIDSLLSIQLRYDYRWEILWGLNYTNWETVTITRYIEERNSMRTTWQHLSWLFSPLGYYQLVAEEVPSWFAAGKLTLNEVTNIGESYKSDYLRLINNVRDKNDKELLTENDIFSDDSSVYRVYLQTYNDGRYTNYQIGGDIIVMDLMYEYQGEVYHVPYEDISNDGSFGGTGSGTTGGSGLGGDESNLEDFMNFLNGAKAWISNNWILLAIIPLVIIGLPVLGILLSSVSFFNNSIKGFSKSINNSRPSRNYNDNGFKGTMTFLIVLILILVTLGLANGWF